MTAFTLDTEFGPEERYRIYERTPSWSLDRGGRSGVAHGSFTLIATCPSPEAVGVALCQLAEDRWEAGDFTTPVVGVLDGETKRWVSGLWAGGGTA